MTETAKRPGRQRGPDTEQVNSLIPVELVNQLRAHQARKSTREQRNVSMSEVVIEMLRRGLGEVTRLQHLTAKRAAREE